MDKNILLCCSQSRGKCFGELFRGNKRVLPVQPTSYREVLPSNNLRSQIQTQGNHLTFAEPLCDVDIRTEQRSYKLGVAQKSLSVKVIWCQF